MEELIELILGNPLLLILLIGGLISLFRRGGDNKDQQSEQRQQQTGEQTNPKKPSPFGDFLDRMEDALSDEKEETEAKPKPSYSNEPAKERMSAQDKRMEQMQQISNQIDAGTYEGEAGAQPSGSDNEYYSGIQNYSTPSQQNEVSQDHKTHKLRKQMKKRLRKDNLIDSIIMAEVLGEPRSKQPYQRRNMNKHRLY